MGSDRLQRGLLGALVLVLLIVGYREWPRTESSPTSNGARTGGSAARSSQPAVTAPEVHLGVLDAARPAPAPTTRNLFRFKPKAPPPSQTGDIARGRGAPAVPTGPPPPAGPPPIALKFIGIFGSPKEKIAVLRDPAGHVDYGGEGAIIEGRYRVLRIGEESVELAYLDGRGRQTIRLSGS
jgi:hypothetical protein